jgi:uncharacterized protein (UPF0332 family)
MTTGPGKDYAAVLIERAKEALLASQTLLEKGLLADAISRAYYAMYYSTQAILNQNGLNAKSHSGTINLFGHEIVEKAKVPKELGRLLNKAHALRQKSDYDASADFEFADVETLVEEADYFVTQIGQVVLAPKGNHE